MTVAELIEHLQRQDPNALVMVATENEAARLGTVDGDYAEEPRVWLESLCSTPTPS